MSKEDTRVVLIVPCFNEGKRLEPGPFLQALESQADLGLCFVDDGSTDNSWEILEGIREKSPERVVTLKLDRNRGKAEAVRSGVLHLLGEGDDVPPDPRYLGYWDADLSAPLTALPHFLDVFRKEPECRLVMGARVQLLGRTIVRKPSRHYLGRIFSTLASMALDLPVYDTQCGAKLFRVDAQMRRVFAEPFSDPWIFDVEVLARLQTIWGAETQSRIIELPLDFWEHKKGSKVRLQHGLKALVGIFSIWIRRVREARSSR
jgi:dolichyl-phosphate beta-glucosyltransferase